jgi:hypothetical protein
MDFLLPPEHPLRGPGTAPPNPLGPCLQAAAAKGGGGGHHSFVLMAATRAARWISTCSRTRSRSRSSSDGLRGAACAARVIAYVGVVCGVKGGQSTLMWSGEEGGVRGNSDTRW